MVPGRCKRVVARDNSVALFPMRSGSNLVGEVKAMERILEIYGERSKQAGDQRLSNYYQKQRAKQAKQKRRS